MREADLSALVDSLAFGPADKLPRPPGDADVLLDMYGGRVITRSELSALFAEKRAADKLIDLRSKIFSGGQVDLVAAVEMKREVRRQIGLLSEEKQANLVQRILGGNLTGD